MTRDPTRSAFAADARYNTAVAMADENTPEAPSAPHAEAPKPEPQAPPHPATDHEAPVPDPEAPPAPATDPEAPVPDPEAPPRPATDADAPPAPSASAALQPSSRPTSRGRRRPRGSRRERGPQPPREKGPLPFAQLREAAVAVTEIVGARRALRDAFAILGEKERADLARLVAEDGDWRVRARNIAAGSLGAGRIGKALAAQQISMANVEDLWPLTLSKEEAAERQARVRNARRRDERRAQRDAQREQRSDRVSRAELQKAQDGRVGAQIRIVMPGQERGERRRKDQPADENASTSGESVLDRLGY